MNSEEYSAKQEELAKHGSMTDRERMIFDSGWQLGRNYELRRKIGRTL